MKSPENRLCRFSLDDVERSYSYYGKSPLFYNLFSKFSFLGKDLRKKAINKLNLKPGYKVLDIACGTGLNFKPIEKIIGNKGKIIAIDYTKEMLKQAKKLIKKNKWNNIKLIKADAANIELPGNYFNAIISTLGFSSIPDHKKALITAVNSLKKGKKLVMLEGKLFNFKPLNIIMPILRWSKSWDKGKNLIKDVKELFPNKEIKIEEYSLGSNFILELRK